jgi:hypothetical protein
MANPNQAPTTKELSDNILASFEAKYGENVPILQKAFLRVTSKVLGALIVILYKYAGFLGLQMFIDYVSASETTINGRTIIPLVETGRQLGVSDPRPAVPAELEIEITVTNQTGFLASGTQLIGQTNGFTYLTVGSISLDAATVTGIILAVSDQSGGNGAGVVGNLDPGETVSFINPLPNVDQQTTVLQIVQQGVDGEILETEYRQRVKDRRQNPPQGGASADYVIWGIEVDGIINIYPYTGEPGVVDVYAEATSASSGSQDGIPTQAQREAVYQSIQYDDDTGIANRRPMSSHVTVLPINRLGFDVKVFDLQVDDIGFVRGEIEKALKQYFVDLEPFIDGLSVLPRNDRVTQSGVAGVVNDIVSSFGGIFETAELLLNATPIIIYSLDEGEKAKLNSIEFL